MPAKLNLIGQKFHRFLVLKESPKRNNGVVWTCQCDCGTIKDIPGWRLKKGTTKSCGCYNSELLALRNKRRALWGCEHGTGEYRAWCSMRNRCHNPNANDYPNYGARGITVCQRWRDSKMGLWNFLEYMGRKPSPKHSLDRIDVNGNYEPSNCRWATKETQMNNTRRQRIEGFSDDIIETEYARRFPEPEYGLSMC